MTNNSKQQRVPHIVIQKMYRMRQPCRHCGKRFTYREIGKKYGFSKQRVFNLLKEHYSD